MRHTLLNSTLAVSLLAVLAMPVQMIAQEQEQRRPERPPHYVVTDLGPMGTTFSDAVGATNHGLVGGFATAADGAQHAVLWYKGRIGDIGTPGLGGPNSAAYGVNERGQAAGLAEVSSPDPNGEDFCGYGTNLVCLPFLWQDGVMTRLPTLGGNGEAGQINNRGEVAGNVENATLDTTCLGLGTPQKLQEKPVIWEHGKIHELPTYPGDPDGWTFGINDNGQVAGASGPCSTLNPATGVYILSSHALLWEKDGWVRDLGNLGGTGAFGPGNLAHELNNQGQVVGTSDLKGDTSFHAFLWTRETGMRDLGTLSGDVNSGAISINERGEVVGVSLDASGNTRGFLWQNGVMTDLNKLIPADSPLFLLFAHGINSRGEITGFGSTSTGDVHAFLATPCDRHDADRKWCRDDDDRDDAAQTTERPRVVISEDARKLLQQQLGHRYHMGGPR
jgi:probable HAF family extracellular repeat protein